MALEHEAAWQPADWKWDPLNLTATPADQAPTSKGSGGLAARSHTAATNMRQGCQVDGCNIEVGSMRDYHSRYKICEYHLKAHLVHKDGLPHRFCQQCGKFQPIDDFDSDKRSCRARLDKHNARRRRQREMAHMLKKTGTIDEKLLAEKYGLTEEEIAPKLARMSKQGYSLKPSCSGSAAPSGAQHKSSSPSGSQQPTEVGAFTTSTHGGAPTGCVATVTHLDAEHAATELLKQMQAQQAHQQVASLVQAQAQMAASMGAPHSDLGSMLAAASSEVAPATTLPADATMGGLLLDDEFLDEVFNPMMTAQALLHGQGMASPPQPAAPGFLQMDATSAMALDDMVGLEALTNQLMAAGRLPVAMQHVPMVGGLAANWPIAPPPPTLALHGSMPNTPSISETAMASLPPYLAAQQAGFPSILGGTPTFGSGLQPPPPLPGSLRLDLMGGAARVESPASVHSTATAMDLGGPPPLPGSVLDEALNLLSYDTAQITYVPEEKLVRFSAKLFNCTPAQLPSDLKASLVNMLSCQSMEGYLRPGCVHLTVNALMGPEERALLASSGVRAVVERLVARQPETFWNQHAMLVQLGDKLALVREGRVVHVLATGSSSLFPRVATLRPLVATPDAEGCVEVAVWGYSLDNTEDTVLARCKGTYAEVERASLEADPAWQGMQKLNLRLTGLHAGGAVQLEVMRGGYISGSKVMLLTDDRALVAEVRALEAEESATDVDTLLFQLAASEEFSAGTASRDYSEADRQVLGKSSRRLLAYAVQRKWVAATRTLLATAAADQSPEEAMAAVDIMSVGTTGMPLLQLAVRSQSLGLVQTVLDWGERNGYVFKSTTPGRRGLTALHLSGLVRDGGAIAALLSEKCADALSGWEAAPAEDGSLPIDFARRTGTAGVLERFHATKRYESAAVAGKVATAPAADPEAAPEPGPKLQLVHRKPATASSSRSPSKSLAAEDHHHHHQHSSEEEEDAVVATKAALKARLAKEQEQDALLRFRNPVLERRYQAWYSSGQIPVDIAFLVIATLSQGAWIFRWSLAASWLGMAMIALMAMNAAMMQMAVLFPSNYVGWRELLCVWSHLVHKLAQTAVTLVPPVGTIFSPTYNPSVALLESSSLAQIHMLSFGMKLRFGTHLFVGLFHFASAMAANDAICAAGFPFLPGGACNALMIIWQALACFVLPCTLAYASEKRSRHIFLETMSD